MRSTFSRTFFPAALLLLTALLLVGASFQMLVRNYLNDQALDGLEKDGKAISQMASAYYTEGSLSPREFLANLSLANRVSDADAVIFDGDGRLVLCSRSPFGCKHQGWKISEDYLKKVMREGVDRDTGVFSGLYTDVRYVVSVPIEDARTGRNVGMVMVSSSMESTNAILDRMQDIFLFVSLLAVTLSMIIMSIYARRQSRPLRDLAKTAIDFGHGNLDARVNTSDSYSREIEELALSFNNMADSLQKSEYQRREFVANVSHELKTPMTTIGGYIDGILDGTIPEEKHQHYLQIVSDETKRLSRLVRSMLDISKLQDQGGIPEEKKTRFDLTEAVGQVLITFEQKILSKELNVEVEMPEYPVYVFAQRDHIVQVIYNLIDNAVKFCPEKGTVGMRVTEGGNKAYVSVYNEGETIPAEELPLVFDRFHKTDKSRSQNREGWGLGLYIVKTIICSHGEDISVSSGSGKTEFTFTLPLMN
jgi:signal transduction histidine kinase